MIQAGRMYIPFTRDYGTTSTKALLTTELNWGQGGIRSGIFYPSKVGRDDGVTIWGNVMEDRLQYRFMAAEGQESAALNPKERLRFAGRVSMNFFDTETGWFNAGTYLGNKTILAVGCGVDHQADLIMGDRQTDYTAHTVDLRLDYPVADLPVTEEFAYIGIKNSPNPITWFGIGTGSDGEIISAKAGVLLPCRKFQPFGHYQIIMPDVSGADDTTVYGIGVNYYIKGPANKLTLEWTVADDETNSVDIITPQAAFGF